MKPSDLVVVKQTIGCHTPPMYRDRGIGVVLKVSQSKPLKFPGMAEINVGDDITVFLSSGKIEVFCEESVEIV